MLRRYDQLNLMFNSQTLNSAKSLTKKFRDVIEHAESQLCFYHMLVSTEILFNVSRQLMQKLFGLSVVLLSFFWM